MRFTCILLNEDVSSFEDCLTRLPRESSPLQTSLGSEGMVYLDWKHGVSGPSWGNYLKGVATSPLSELTTTANAGLILIRAKDRFFAFPFGSGRTLLKPEHVVPRFGLKVTVNCVDADSIKSLDSETYESGQFQIRHQAAGKSSLDSFGINPTRDILRAVAGLPINDSLVSGIVTLDPKRKRALTLLAGRDSLTAAISGSLTSLEKYCENLLDAMSGTTYQERFGWMDQLEPITDQKTIGRLIQELLKGLAARDFDHIALTIPEILNPEEFCGFRYPGQESRGEYEDDLDLERFLDYVDGKMALNEDFLNNHFISFYREGDSAVSKKWRVRECLVAQVNLGGSIYVLSGSDWFKVDKNLVDELNSYLKNELELCPISFPDAEGCSDEGEYNDLISKCIDGSLLQDCKLVGLKGMKGSVEPCDVLILPSYLVHVKRKTRSATLSHLFAQGLVSAELLRDSREFNKKWRSHLKGSKEFQKMITFPSFERDKFEVVFLIVCSRPEDVPSKLPFFAKLHLRQVSREIRDMGYRVSICSVKESVSKRSKPKKISSSKNP